MTSKQLFLEEQKFKTPWIFLVIFPTIISLIFILKYIEWNQEAINVSEKDDILGLIIMGIIMFIMMIGLTILFYKMKLITQVNPDGIYFRYPPIISKERFTSKAEISKYEIREYKANREFKGHGIKRGRRFKQLGKAYTVSGRLGLQLYLTNGEKILLGTQRAEALKYAMDKMMGKA